MRTARLLLPGFLSVVILATLFGCATYPSPRVDSQRMKAAHQARGVRAHAPSPCEDSLYVSLRGKPLDQMTDREYEYFTRKDAACSEWQKAQLETKPLEKMADTTERASNTYTALAVIGLIIGVASSLAIAGSY